MLATTTTTVSVIPPTPLYSGYADTIASLHKRLRKPHQKVRTGCSTCKIRRKKCDERKPACSRCTSTGRKCDGYATTAVPMLKPQTQPSLAGQRTVDSRINPTHQAMSLSQTTGSAAISPGSAVQSEPREGMNYPAVSIEDLCSSSTMLQAGSKQSGSLTSRRHGGRLMCEIGGSDDWPASSGPFADGAYGSTCSDQDELNRSEEEALEEFILTYEETTLAVVETAAPELGHSLARSTQSLKQSDSTSLVKTGNILVGTALRSASSNTSVALVKHNSQLPIASGITFQKLSSRPSAYVHRSLVSYGGQISEIERHCFTYFRYRTGPNFSSYFDSSIWRTYAVSVALTHPVVLSCAAACGAAHRRWSFDVSREAFEYCAHADRLYKKAIGGLERLRKETEERLSGLETTDRDAVMIIEMLLGVFQGFQGNYTKTVTHINKGIKHMLSRPMTLVHSESRYCAITDEYKVFCRLFAQLNTRAFQLFGAPANLLVKWGSGGSFPAVPPIFESLHHARDILFTEIDWIMCTPARMWQDKEHRLAIQDFHIRRLLNWNVTYANTIQVMERTPQQKKAYMLLKTAHNAAYLLLYLTSFVTSDVALDAGPESGLRAKKEVDDDDKQQSCLALALEKLWQTVEQREDLSTNLERVKIFVEDILEDDGAFNYDEHSVSFDSAVGPGYDTTAETSPVPEASGKTRHLVKQLMRKRLNDGSLWKMLGVYGVAERISAVEEHAVLDAVQGIIPDLAGVKWIDVACMMEKRKILLRYCRPDNYGLGMIWTQEWWAF